MTQTRELVAKTKQRIKQNLVVFEDLVARSESCLAKCDMISAAAYAEVAAAYAMWNHGGIWASPRLERVLYQIGENKVYGGSRELPRARHEGKPANVLHVLTQAYSLGGHTRFVWRWIQQDAGRKHSVALTRQGSMCVPEPLVQSVRSAGGDVHLLDHSSRDLLACARSLRSLAMGFDQLVLHVHPCDVVAVLALSNRQNIAPTIFLNHIDNVFWLGTRIADVYAHIRQSGIEISTQRRNLTPEQCVTVPIPVDPVETKSSQTEARRRLGFKEDEVILLSVAANYKYEPMLGEISFIEALRPVLNRYKNVTVIVIGAEQGAQWETAAREFGSRVRVLGKRSDTQLFYAAADLYLDSFPVCSLTSLLEAGVNGLPLVTLSLDFNRARLLCADSPGLNWLSRHTDVDSYRETICDLVGKSGQRAFLGGETRNAILALHSGFSWLEYIRHAYAKSAFLDVVSSERTSSSEARTEAIDVRLACIYQKSGRSHELEGILSNDIGLFTFWERLKLWGAYLERGWSHLPTSLLSEYGYNRLRRSFLRLKRYGSLRYRKLIASNTVHFVLEPNCSQTKPASQ